MNSLFSWLYLGAWFFGALMVTSAVGIGAYFFAHWLEDAFPDMLVLLEVVLGCVVFGLTWAMFAWSLIALAIMGGICALGTLAERATLTPEPGWGASFAKMLFTTSLTLTVYLVIVPILDEAGAFNSLVRGQDTSFNVGCGLGALCSPSVFPLFVWVWRSSRMRPGIDRHLNSEETSAR